MNAPARFHYPRRAQIERIVAAAKACGLDVAGFEVSPDGTIRIMEARAVTDKTDFDRFADRL
jgi:hypothetical protein